MPEPEKHNCSIHHALNGPMVAVDHCYEDDNGRFQVSNGEYGNQVLFCPFCGAKAPNQDMKRE